MQRMAIVDPVRRFFNWRCNLNLVNKFILASTIACLTGIAAQIKIFLPWTPVPITAQTFVVLLAGVILGRWWGGISQAIYAAIGMTGVPWFAGYNTCAIVGPTGGYIIGFILAALFIGHLTDRGMENMGLLPIFALMFFSNFFLIYGPGLLQLGLWHYFIESERIAIRELLLIGVVPFIAGDLIKIAAAASLARAINDKIG